MKKESSITKQLMGTWENSKIPQFFREHSGEIVRDLALLVVLAGYFGLQWYEKYLNQEVVIDTVQCGGGTGDYLFDRYSNRRVYYPGKYSIVVNNKHEVWLRPTDDSPGSQNPKLLGNTGEKYHDSLLPPQYSVEHTRNSSAAEICDRILNAWGTIGRSGLDDYNQLALQYRESIWDDEGYWCQTGEMGDQAFILEPDTRENETSFSFVEGDFQCRSPFLSTFFTRGEQDDLHIRHSSQE